MAGGALFHLLVVVHLKLGYLGTARLVGGFVPKGLRETGMCLVLVGDGKRICQTIIIARRPIAPLPLRVSFARLVPNPQAQLILLFPSPE